MGRLVDVRLSLLITFEHFPAESLDIQEIFGSHYSLPELGPLGTHGLANRRDFEHPVAAFEVDQNDWESKCHLLFF